MKQTRSIDQKRARDSKNESESSSTRNDRSPLELRTIKRETAMNETDETKARDERNHYYYHQYYYHYQYYYFAPVLSPVRSPPLISEQWSVVKVTGYVNLCQCISFQVWASALVRSRLEVIIVTIDSKTKRCNESYRESPVAFEMSFIDFFSSILNFFISQF